MKSQLKEIGPVTFPEHTGEKVYMLPFNQRDGLPKELARWQPTVDAMLQGVQTDQPIYLMIDQGEVKIGRTHRRPGVHIDGNWLPDIKAHGRPDGGGGHGWNTKHLTTEALILASDVSACKAYVGEVDGEPSDGGDCSHLNLSQTTPVRLEAGRAYIGNVTMLHESVPLDCNCKRTVVRLNVPGVTF